jgi:hypothetical protein
VTNDRRNFICGGSFFFTANLAEHVARMERSAIRERRRNLNHRSRIALRSIRATRYPINWAGDAADNRSRFGER